MSYKNIERSREVRLWIRDIIGPIAGVVLLFVCSPTLREGLKQAFNVDNRWNR